MRPRSTRMGLIVQRGIFGMGALVVAVSVTQGITGIVGVLLMVMVMGAVGSLGVWLFESVTQRVR